MSLLSSQYFVKRNVSEVLLDQSRVNVSSNNKNTCSQQLLQFSQQSQQQSKHQEFNSSIYSIKQAHQTQNQNNLFKCMNNSVKEYKHSVKTRAHLKQKLNNYNSPSFKQLEDKGNQLSNEENIFQSKIQSVIKESQNSRYEDDVLIETPKQPIAKKNQSIIKLTQSVQFFSHLQKNAKNKNSSIQQYPPLSNIQQKPKQQHLYHSTICKTESSEDPLQANVAQPANKIQVIPKGNASSEILHKLLQSKQQQAVTVGSRENLEQQSQKVQSMYSLGESIRQFHWEYLYKGTQSKSRIQSSVAKSEFRCADNIIKHMKKFNICQSNTNLLVSPSEKQNQTGITPKQDTDIVPQFQQEREVNIQRVKQQLKEKAQQYIQKRVSYSQEQHKNLFSQLKEKYLAKQVQKQQENLLGYERTQVEKLQQKLFPQKVDISSPQFMLTRESSEQKQEIFRQQCRPSTSHQQQEQEFSLSQMPNKCNNAQQNLVQNYDLNKILDNGCEIMENVPLISEQKVIEDEVKENNHKLTQKKRLSMGLTLNNDERESALKSKSGNSNQKEMVKLRKISSSPGLRPASSQKQRNLERKYELKYSQDQNFNELIKEGIQNKMSIKKDMIKKKFEYIQKLTSQFKNEDQLQGFMKTQEIMKSLKKIQFGNRHLLYRNFKKIRNLRKNITFKEFQYQQQPFPPCPYQNKNANNLVSSIFQQIFK